MQAMQLRQLGQPLLLTDLPDPQPASCEVRVRVASCGVCRTDLHVVDGELPNPRLPIIPGHEIVGRIDQIDPKVNTLWPGMRVGIPWLGSTCGICPYCRQGDENLCDRGVHRIYARWRLCDPCRGEFSVRLRNCPRKAMMLRPRRCYVLVSLAGGRFGWRDQGRGSVFTRLWSCRAYHGPSGAVTGPGCICLYAARRFRWAAVCKETGCRMGGRLR